jgi:hypothetical protein
MKKTFAAPVLRCEAALASLTLTTAQISGCGYTCNGSG